MKTSPPTILQWDYWFGEVDSLPVVLFRICFGALLCKNALYLLPLGQLFFSDDGITPRAQAWQDPAQCALGQFSVFNYVAGGWLAGIIFGVWAAIALALLVGYHARTMAILNFLLWLSLLHRNPFILHGPDHVMLVLSFWLIFLPLDRRRAYAFPLRVVQIQIALIYLFTGYYKWQGAYWRQGDALFYVLQQNSFLAPTGAWFAAAAPLWLLHLLTWSTLLIELGFVLLVFAPVLQPWAKAAGLALAALLHLGIALTMAIPDFSLVMVIGYLFFLEPSWVAWPANRVRRLLRFAPLPLVQPLAVGQAAAAQHEAAAYPGGLGPYRPGELSWGACWRRCSWRQLGAALAQKAAIGARQRPPNRSSSTRSTASCTLPRPGPCSSITRVHAPAG